MVDIFFWGIVRASHYVFDWALHDLEGFMRLNVLWESLITFLLILIVLALVLNLIIAPLIFAAFFENKNLLWIYILEIPIYLFLLGEHNS